MDSKGFWIILAVVVIGFFGIVMFNKKDKEAESSSSTSSQGSQNYYGKLDSPVTVTEFVDYQCEACYAYYPYVKQVKELYKDKIRFQIRNFPIDGGDHKFNRQAARSVEAAARQGKFWEMHDKVFEGQKIWEQTSNPQNYFDQYAQDINLDMEKFKADRASTEINDLINKDLQDVKSLGGDGTPTFSINGKKVDNPQPTVEALSKMIDDALKESAKQ